VDVDAKEKRRRIRPGPSGGAASRLWRAGSTWGSGAATSAAPGRARLLAWGIFACVALAVAGCATQPPHPLASSESRSATEAGRAAIEIPAPPKVDTAVENRILALDPEHITEHDVRTTLELGPSPRIFLVHGGLYGTHLLMMSFAKFLIGMGYPEAQIRDPSDGAYSQNPFGSSARLAGEIAWSYEHDGVRPMMVGHSQGGIQAVKVLYELNGAFADELAVWDPVTDTEESRHTIIDPLTGAQRPVKGVSLAYVSVVGAGGVALAAPVHWGMAQRLHTIPNTVEDFTGFSIDNDLIAWTFPGPEIAHLYHHNGTAAVRNVTLPGSYSHVFVPVTQALAADPTMRDWLNAYVPGADNGKPPGTGDGRDNNALWAADVWFSIKKHWCLEAQHFIRARRAGLAAQ
jgi:hypothetical protein